MSQKGRYSGKPTGGDPGYPRGTRNGKIPLSLMRRCESQPHLADSRGYLWPAAAIGFDRMTAAAAQERVVIRLIIGYRDYATQVEMREQWAAKGRPQMAAVPGRSSHGWGTASDVDRHRPGVIAWLRKHATEWGWDWPRWAVDGAGVEEPWHLQFIRGWQPEEARVEEIVIADEIAGAAGVIDGGQGYAWVRPLAERYGMEIRAVGPDFVELSRGSRRARIPARIADGKALIRLDSLAGVGLEADWTRAIVLREVG